MLKADIYHMNSIICHMLLCILINPLAETGSNNFFLVIGYLSKIIIDITDNQLNGDCGWKTLLRVKFCHDKFCKTH